MSTKNEISHYVVTAHPPGGVLFTAKCNFITPYSSDVLVAKSRRLEIRQLRTSSSSSSSEASAAGESNSMMMDGNNNNNASPFPVLFSVPINGRITSLVPIRIPSSPTALIFMTTDRFRYAVISYHDNTTNNAATAATTAAAGASASSSTLYSPYPLITHASGSIKGEDYNILGREAEAGPLVAVDPAFRCIAMHVYDGIISILPIDSNYIMPASSSIPYKSSTGSTGGGGSSSSSSSRHSVLKGIFHCRIEERKLLAMTFLHYPSSHQNQQQPMPLLCLLYMDARGVQHMTTHVVNLQKKQFHYHGSNHHSVVSTAQQHQQNQNNSSTVDWIRKSSVDGGSSLLIAVPPPKLSLSPPPVAAAAAAAAPPANNKSPTTTPASTTTGGVIIIGQRQFTYCSSTTTKTIPVPQALFLTYEELPPDPNVSGGMPRYLLGDEFGNLHMLTLITVAAQSQDTANNSPLSTKVVNLTLDTLGSCTLSTSLAYLGGGLVYVGSALGDSQLVQIHDEPIPVEEVATADAATAATAVAGGAAEQDGGDDLDDDDHDVLLDTTYIHVVEEYTNLGPILDFDLVPTNPGSGNSTNNNAGAGTTAASGNAVATTSGASSSSQQHPNVQCQVVTASGSSKSGSLRLIRNGIGMNEYASVEIPGIQNMWSLRKSFHDKDDGYLVQSFVGETRVLGVSSSNTTNNSMDNSNVDDAMEEDHTGRERDDNGQEEDSGAGGTLEEVDLPGLESMAPTLYMGNVQLGDRYLQITKSAVRLFARTSSLTAATSSSSSDELLLDSWSGPITVASANEAGQIAVALSGGMVLYFCVSGSNGDKLEKKFEKQMVREVSCLDLHPLVPSDPDAMEVEQQQQKELQTTRTTFTSALLAVGLWDDFTVRLLSLENSLDELVKIRLSTQEDEDGEEDAVGTGQARRNRNNMMARSLSLLTLDFSSNIGSGAGSHNAGGGSISAPGVDMLFVGLGDGTLISFAVVSRNGKVTVQSKKEVCLGTQRIDLIPLSTAQGGTCVLATGDRPTVIYLAGVGGTSANQFNPKLCYSSVNLSTSEDDDGDDVSRPPSQQSIAVNVAAPFFSPLLFDTASLRNQHYSLCVADDSSLRLGVIDDIQKLHVTTCRLGMAPRRIVHCLDGRLFAVGCVESGIKHFGLGGAEATSMANCIRFMDDTTFDDIHRVDLDAYEQVLSMVYVSLKVPSKEGVSADGSPQGAQYKPFLLVGTGYALPDENEPTRGRIIVYSCQADEAAATTTNRAVREVAQHSTTGGVYSMSQFYEGTALCTVNSKTMIGQLVDDAGTLKFTFVGIGHHGHILSLCVKSRARPMLPEPTSSSSTVAAAASAASGIAMDSTEVQENTADIRKKPAKQEMLAIVGDLMRSISLVQYYPQHGTLEEVARDFNANWTTAVEMLTDDVYIGGENWNNLFCLRRNKTASAEEIKCRLDTIGEFHLGEMCNKFMSGSLVMPVSSSSNIRGAVRRTATPQKKRSEKSSAGASSTTAASSPARVRRPIVVTGSQTLFGTVDGTLGVILGLDGRTAAFFSTLERAMAKTIRPVGDFDHQLYRACQTERRIHPAHGFVDGDLVESFLDLDRNTMDAVVNEMNRDGGWEVDDAIAVRSTDRGGNNNTDSAAAADTETPPELSVDDVLAMVEEITMLH